MSEWTEAFARRAGLDPLTPEEEGRLLDASRDVAHRTERRDTPLTTFLLGMAVAKQLEGGAGREKALREGLELLAAALPDSHPGGDPPG